MKTYRVTLPFSGTITAANTDVDLASVQPGDDEVWSLVGLKLGQTSEIGDTQEEGIGLQIVRQTGAFSIGTGGSSGTAGYAMTGQPAVGATLRIMDTTIGSGGTQSVIEDFAWNLRGSPMEMWWDPENGYEAIQGEALTIRWNTTVADDVAVRGTAIFDVVT